MYERVDDCHDNCNQVEPEVQLVRAGRGPPGSDPDLRQIDQARHHSEQQAKDDEPRGALVPKHHGSLGIDDVEDQSSDKATEADRIEKAIDALGNGFSRSFEMRFTVGRVRFALRWREYEFVRVTALTVGNWHVPPV